MSKREDILKVFSGKNPEYVPWYGDLAYWIDYLNDEKLMPKKYLHTLDGEKEEIKNQGLAGRFEEDGLQELHRDLGVGFYLQGFFPFKTKYNFQVENIEENDEIITIYHTPYGELREIWKHIWSTHSWAPKEYLLKSEEDIDKLKYVYENTFYEPDYELAIRRQKMVGDNGIVLVYAPKSPMMELVALRAGIENVVGIYYDYEEKFEELLEIMLKKHNEALDIVLQCPSDCIMVPENMSSDVVGGSLYDGFIEQVHIDWTTKIRNAGKISFVHLDGILNPLLTKLSNSGFDVIEAVTPKPVGDLEIEELRSKVRPETIIWGGIPGGFFTEQMSDEEFDKFVIRVIKLMKNNNRFVLGVADQVSPTATFSRIKRVSELVNTYGKYDLNI